MNIFTTLLSGVAGVLIGMLIISLCVVTSKEERLREWEEDDYVFLFPKIPNETIYEIVINEGCESYIVEHKVTDVSIKGIEYDGTWVEWESSNIFMTRMEAEKKLKQRLKLVEGG